MKKASQEKLEEKPGLDCYVLKLDVEGSEVEALAGASKLIAGGRLAAVYAEDNPRLLRLHGHDGEKLAQSLKEAGLSTTRVGTRDDEDTVTNLIGLRPGLQNAL